MGQAIKHPEKVYGNILVPQGAGINFHTDIHYDLPHLKDIFNRAAHGEEIVDNNLTDELVGNKTGLTRSDPTAKTVDYSADLKPLERLIQIRAVERPLTRQENEDLEKGIKDLVQKTGVNEDFLRYELEDDENTFRESNKGLPDSFGSSCSELTHSIGEMLAKQARLGALPPDEEQVLKQSLRFYAQRENLSPKELRDQIDDFKKTVAGFDSLHLASAIKAENDLIDDVKKTDGTYYGADKKPEDYLAVPKFKMDELNRYGAIPFDVDDLPHRVPYFTIQQSEFLTALHESEHATEQAGRHPVTPDGYPAELKTQAKEIDADGPVLKFLNDTGDRKGHDYWLQWRNVSSFSDALDDDYSHDTATFLRVLEKTGQQIDLAKFREEKKGLMDKINERLDSENAKTGDIMGAVRDVLRDDKNHPEKHLLTPMQRAEAEQYLEDAKALGFKAHSRYPRNDAVAAADPEPASPASPVPQTPAAAV